MAPTIPRRVVLLSPMACAPGMTARATRPTTKPTIMCQMMCSIGFLRLDGARVHGQLAPDHHFPHVSRCVSLGRHHTTCRAFSATLPHADRRKSKKESG